MILNEGNVCQMYEINTDKVMMACMIIIRIFVLNVTASNEKKDRHLFLCACKGHLESLELCACLNGEGGPRGGSGGPAPYSPPALAHRNVPVGGQSSWLPASSARYLARHGWSHLSTTIPPPPLPPLQPNIWRSKEIRRCKPWTLLG